MAATSTPWRRRNAGRWATWAMAPASRPELRSERAVQAGRNRVEGVLDERAVDRQPAAVAHVHAQPQPHVRGHGPDLGHHVLEIEVPREVTPGDPPEVDGIFPERV